MGMDSSSIGTGRRIGGNEIDASLLGPIRRLAGLAAGTRDSNGNESGLLFLGRWLLQHGWHVGVSWDWLVDLDNGWFVLAPGHSDGIGVVSFHHASVEAGVHLAAIEEIRHHLGNVLVAGGGAGIVRIVGGWIDAAGRTAGSGSVSWRDGSRSSPDALGIRRPIVVFDSQHGHLLLLWWCLSFSRRLRPVAAGVAAGKGLRGLVDGF